VPVAEIHDGAQRSPPPPPGEGEGAHWERVRALPARQREVLTLRYAADLTHAEIASALGCTEEAARRAAADGLKNLRKELTDVAVTA
jgi:DNA-directed RNA polymerase specialized sigma24 family protein